MPKISVEKIAELAGVSRATAYRALASTGSVSVSVRARVLKIARENDYYTAGLRNVAIIIPESSLHGYLSMVLDTLIPELRKQQFFPELVYETQLENLDDSRLFGIISIIYIDGIGKKWAFYRNIPLVAINSSPSMLDGVYSVYTNERQMIDTLMNKIYESGHRRVGLLLSGDCNYNLNNRERIKFFEDYAAHHGMYGIWKTSLNSSECIYSVGALLKEHVTAIIVANESLGAVAHKIILNLGIRIPEDISVVGYENPEVSPYLTPALTTMAQDIGRLATEAINVMKSRALGLPVRNLQIDGWFIGRESLGAAASPSRHI